MRVVYYDCIVLYLTHLLELAANKRKQNLLLYSLFTPSLYIYISLSSFFSFLQNPLKKFNRSDVGIGTIVGSAVFNVLFVIGMCAVFSKEVLGLTWWPLFRDCCWYTLTLALTGAFFANGDGQTIEWWEALTLFIVYIGYVIFMAGNKKYERFFKMNVLPASWGLSYMPEDNDEEVLIPLQSPLAFCC